MAGDPLLGPAGGASPTGWSIATLPAELADHPDCRARFVGLDGVLVETTFARMHTEVTDLVARLRECGLGPADLVGLLGPNSPEWIVADLALIAIGAVTVALPAPTGTPDLGALVERYGLTALLVGPGVPLPGDRPPETGVLTERPVTLTPRPRPPDARTVDPDVFTIAFSSGTAGTTKGLRMSVAGLEHILAVSGEGWGMRPDDDVLVVLPFSVYQQRFLFYMAIRHGCSVSVVAPERMFQRMRELEPTVVLGPPSFFEIVETRLRGASRWRRLPVALAGVVHRVLPERLGRPLRARLGRRWWTPLYGTRVRLMLTGSAPVPPRLVTLFQRLGAPLYEIYGSAELGWIAMNLPGRSRIGTSGPPAPGMRITVGDEDGGDGEIVVHAEHPLARGYVFAGEETQSAVFRADGGIVTGDLGRWEHGFLRLVGRTTNVIVNRSGVKINPEGMERDVERSCAVDRAIVVPADRAGTLVCVVWLDDCADPERTAAVEAHVRRANQERPASHRIDRVVFRPRDELCVQTGLLTRNHKVDRGAVARTALVGSVREDR